MARVLGFSHSRHSKVLKKPADDGGMLGRWCRDDLGFIQMHRVIGPKYTFTWGWLKPNTLTWIPWELRVKPLLKAAIALA